MAENNEEFEKIKQMTSAEQMLESIEGKADPFAGYSLEELQAIASVINGFDNSKAKEAVVAALNAEISKQQNNAQPEEQQPTATDSQEQSPVEAEAQTQDELKDFDFITEPSYSQHQDFKKFHSEALKENNTLSNEDIMKMTSIVNNAQKVVDLAANEEITPENAVLLKDYIEILRDAKTFDADEKEKVDALEIEVNNKLVEFDKENGLDKLEGVSAEELKTREDSLYKIADGRLQARYGNAELSADDVDSYEILKQLAVQEMKNSPIYPSDELLEEVAQKAGITKEDTEAIFNKGAAGIELNDVQKEVFDTLYKEVIIDKAREFDQKFDDLKEQFETAKAIERVSLSADEIYPDKKDMSPEQLEEQRKKREKYIEEQITREGGLPSEEQWIEENILRTLRDRHHIADGDDNEIKTSYKDEYEELKQAYEIVAKEIATATKTAYAIKVEQLASRSARITNSPDINPNAKEFIKNYSEKNKDSYKVGKTALSIGKSVVLSQGIKRAFGFKGMAAYSAYRTSKLINKSWNGYKNSLQQGDKASLLGYCSYLKKNPKELTNVASSVSKTAVMSTLAVVGTITGIDNVPGLSAAIVGGINAVTAAAKIHQNKEEIKNLWKNRKQIMNNWQEKHPKMAKLAKKSKWAGIALGAAALAGTAYALLKSDDSQDVIDSITPSSNGNGGDSPIGKFLDENSYHPTNDLSQGQPDVVTPYAPGQEPIVTEAPSAENGGTEAAQTAAEVPALTEADVKLMVTDCKMGPDPIVAKLESMGVLSAEDKAKLIDSGGRKDGVASRVLASYLGHPYDNTEVPVHANLTPEQQQELNQFLRSPEYQQQCDECNASANANRLAKLRGQIRDNNGGNGGNDGNDGNNGTVKDNADVKKTPTPKLTKVNVDVNRAVLGATIKKGVSSGVVEVERTGDPFIDQHSAAVAKHLADPKAKHITTSIDGSSGKFTVRGDAEDLKVKGKVTTADGTTIKETTRISGDSKYSKYKGVTHADMDNDGKEEQIVGTVTAGGKHYTGIETSSGKKVILENDGQSVKKTEIQGSVRKYLKKIYKGRGE
ncbi:MAG: hypothetical protein IJ532_00305 [Alphaproteobacteria bacterium]|nr:hypothetical protein [Alphaproteobacteria bacterium]